MKVRPAVWLLNEVTTPKSTDIVSLNGYNWYSQQSEDGKPQAVLGIRHCENMKVEAIEATTSFVAAHLTGAGARFRVAARYMPGELRGGRGAVAARRERAGQQYHRRLPQLIRDSLHAGDDQRGTSMEE